jgi:ankyrin repeat protein
LLVASLAGRELVVKHLLDIGADVGDDNKDGWKSLQKAAFNGHKSTVKLLLEKGADV